MRYRTGARVVLEERGEIAAEGFALIMFDTLSHDQSKPVYAGLEVEDCEALSRTTPSVIHEGDSIAINIPSGANKTKFLLPLRNGFPIYANDRQAPVFAVYNHFHEVVGLALKVPGYGLCLNFRKRIHGGRFYFHINGEVGRA